MTYYVGIVDGSADVWGVRIPDFPGCHGAGASVQDAVADATRALREFATDMFNEGEALPEPRDLLAIDKALNAADEPDGIRVYIPLLVDKARPVRANISLDAGLLEKIDIEAKRRGLTRSAFLASAAMDKIAEAR
jgi:predicted RNase H-like HicB family nuclease